MVERRGQNGVFDWRIGEDAFQETGGVRDLENPPAYRHPLFYQGNFWGNAGALSTNAGVQNRWFFLLSNGGFQNNVNVAGIGPDNAARIAWNTLLYYLGQNSNYNDARNGSINAAIALYGLCSNEVLQVTNAWAAVGVGAAGNPNCIQLNPSMVQVCFDPPTWPWNDFPFTITANFRPANGNITWNFPPSFTFTTSGNSATVHSGPMYPFASETISATVTSPGGNSATATTQYTTYHCSVGPGPVEQRNRQGNISGEEPAWNNAPLKIFPNPTNSVLNFVLNESAFIHLADINGKVLVHRKFNQGFGSIPTASYPSGVYTLRATYGNNKVETRKILIQH